MGGIWFFYNFTTVNNKRIYCLLFIISSLSKKRISYQCEILLQQKRRRRSHVANTPHFSICNRSTSKSF